MKVDFPSEPFDLGDIVSFGGVQGVVTDGEVSSGNVKYTLGKHPLVGNPLMFWSLKSGRYAFYVSMRKIEKCLFSRRIGKTGKRILGYSICLRLFNKDIL